MYAAGTWKALAARFRAVAADARSGAELYDRLYPLLREAGQGLLADLEAGHLFARPGFAPKFRADLDRERAQKRGIPEHRRAQRGVTDALFLDPYCRRFTLYAARHLADEVDHPACGFAAFDNRNRDESQTRAMLIERAQAYAQACELIAKRMSTPLPVPRVTFDQSGAMIQSGPMPLSRLLREVVDRARALLARIEACERTASGDYNLRDPHAGSIAGGVRVLWQEMVWLAGASCTATIEPEPFTTEQSGEFRSRGVVARAVTPTRGLRPLADAIKQLTFALALDDAGRFPDPIPAASVAKIRTVADELDRWRDTIMRAERDELRTIADAFADLAKRDATLTARLTEVGEARRVWVLSNDGNAAALRTFRRLASEAARTLGVARPSRPDGSADDWLRHLFAVGPDMGCVETEHCDMAESQRGDTTEAVPFVSRAIRNAAEASALVVRRVAAQYDAEQPTAQPAPQMPPGGGGNGVPRPPAAPADAIDPAILAAAVVKAIESRGAPADDDAPAAKLPTLKPWAMEAWKARQVGMTVTAIAATLADKYNDPRITQPRVSEQIQRAMLHAEASGLAVDAARVLPQVGSRAPARTLDPAAAELGKRTDGKAHHLRERERQKAQDGDDDE